MSQLLIRGGERIVGFIPEDQPTRRVAKIWQESGVTNYRLKGVKGEFVYRGLPVQGFEVGAYVRTVPTNRGSMPIVDRPVAHEPAPPKRSVFSGLRDFFEAYMRLGGEHD